ncbi:MAG: hypothetical protein GY851_07910 [bacterium]|nr:hypothetical protein [bacterium]
MVALNITFFVELILFGIFLWVTNKIVLRPMLKTMDAREDAIRQNETSAESDAETAEQLKAKYTGEIAGARRSATSQIEAARLKALGERMAQLSARRTEAEETVGVVRTEATGKVDAESARCDELAPGLAEAMIDRLGLGGQSL